MKRSCLCLASLVLPCCHPPPSSLSMHRDQPKPQRSHACCLEEGEIRPCVSPQQDAVNPMRPKTLGHTRHQTLRRLRCPTSDVQRWQNGKMADRPPVDVDERKEDDEDRYEEADETTQGRWGNRCHRGSGITAAAALSSRVDLHCID